MVYLVYLSASYQRIIAYFPRSDMPRLLSGPDIQNNSHHVIYFKM